MDLDSFASLLQLAATLNIALVAVEYAQGYTHVLSQKVFRFPEKVQNELKTLSERIPDQETLNRIEPQEINGKSTSILIEEIKRKRELFFQEYARKEKLLMDEIGKICHSKSFSFLSLFFCFYSIAALFVSGFSPQGNRLWQTFWITYTLLSAAVAIWVWMQGEKQTKFRWMNFSSLKHSLLYSLSAIFFSVATCLAFLFFPEKSVLPPAAWNTIVVFSAVLPFLNFCIFYLKTKSKARNVKLSIQKTLNELAPEAEEIIGKAEKLRSVCDLNNDLVPPASS